ncbi:unnamed protein product [Ascophyllum nodosum]
MPRSRRSAPARKAAPARRSAPPAPRPAAKPPAQQQQSSGGGFLSGMASTMAQGFAFGSGSAVAHRAVGAVMGGGGSSSAEHAEQPSAQSNQQPQIDPCDMDKQNFGQCLQNNNNDVTACQFVFEALQTCQMEAKRSYN